MCGALFGRALGPEDLHIRNIPAVTFLKAKACLDATPWPFDIEDLEEPSTHGV